MITSLSSPGNTVPGRTSFAGKMLQHNCGGCKSNRIPVKWLDWTRSSTVDWLIDPSRITNTLVFNCRLAVRCLLPGTVACVLYYKEKRHLQTLTYCSIHMYHIGSSRKTRKTPTVLIYLVGQSGLFVSVFGSARVFYRLHLPYNTITLITRVIITHPSDLPYNTATLSHWW